MNKQALVGLGLITVSLVVHGEEQNPLLGCWQCSSDSQPFSLRFDAKSYIIDGEPQPYELAAGAIRVREPDGYSSYAYTLKDGQLTIFFDDAPPFRCSRLTCPRK